MPYAVGLPGRPSLIIISTATLYSYTSQMATPGEMSFIPLKII